MRNRKSRGGRAYEAVPVHPVFGAITPRTFQAIYAALPEAPRRTWANPPDPRRGISAFPQSVAVRSIPRQVQVPRGGPRGGRFVYLQQPGGALIDARTGEILSAKRVAERVATDPCRRSKDNRRAAVLAGGYGGTNGFRNYKPHSEC